jgi:hypothetical protein
MRKLIWLVPFAAIAALMACGTAQNSVTSASGTPSATAAQVTPAATTKPALGNTALIQAAANDYQYRAATAKANYYKEARNRNHSVSAAATQRLDNWFTGSARKAIIDQVNRWDPNYSVNIDVIAILRVTSGHILPDGQIAIQTIETWRVVTEGGPVLNKDGTSTTQETQVHRTIQLKHFSNGWAVSSIT